jgi:hypothetical protein
MKRKEMVSAISTRLGILHRQDVNFFIDDELPLPYLLDKLAETALETVELEGMLPPPDFSETYYSADEPAGYHPNRWEDEDEDILDE